MTRQEFITNMVDAFMADKNGINSGMDAALQYVLDHRADLFYTTIWDASAWINIKDEFKKT